MSKFINGQKDQGENDDAQDPSGARKIPPIKINFSMGDEKNDAELVPPAPGNPPGNKGKGPEDDPGLDKDENMVFVPMADNRFPLAVLVLVSFIGLALLVLNLRLLEEIKFERQTLLSLSTNIEKMANQMTGLDKVVVDFKEQSLEQMVGLTSSVNEINFALSAHEMAMNGLADQIYDFKSGLKQINVALAENKADMVAVNKNNEGIQAKLDAISSANQNLVAQVGEIRDILKPKAEEIK